jgi:predicted house-cleaning noncanonical NTP pyrophosphatase (MazG superfamily)
MGIKLVRDRIHEVKWRHDKLKKYLRPTKDVVEHHQLLVQKLLEEVGEFLAASNQEERAQEAADVLEVLIAFLMQNHYARYNEEIDRAIVIASIMNAMNKKFNERGGFDEGAVYVGEGD